MGWFSDIAGSVVGGVLGLGGSLFSSNANAEAAAASIAFQRESMQNKYQWAVKDLKAAGLNPMMAYGGISGGSAPGAVYHTENPGTAAMQGAASANQIQLALRQQANLDMVAKSQADANSAVASKAQAETININANTESGLYKAQSESYGASADESRQRAQLALKQQAEIEQSIVESVARIEKFEAETKNLEKERELLNENIRTARTGRAEIQSRTQLNQVSAALQSREKDLINERIKTQQALTAYQDVLTLLEELKVPKQRNDAFYRNSAVGKYIDRYVPKLGEIFWPKR